VYIEATFIAISIYEKITLWTKEEKDHTISNEKGSFLKDVSLKNEP